MTSRQRLLTALAIRQPDRVPISCYEMAGYDMQSWYNRQDSYQPLMDLIRRWTDCVLMTSVPPCPLGNAADAVRAVEAQTAWSQHPAAVKQTRQGKSVYTEAAYHTPKGRLRGIYRADDDVFTVWTCEHLLKSVEDIDKYVSFGWQAGRELDLTELAGRQAELGENGIVMVSVSDPVCEAAELFGMELFLELCLRCTQRIKYLLDFIHERQIAHLGQVLKAGAAAGVNWGECLFRICGPEYVTEPYLAPGYFSLLVTPYLKRMSQLIHESGAMVRVHCHGRIKAVLQEIVKADPDALDPVEPPPDGDIELGEVKKRIGRSVCLFGNIEARLLEQGEPQQVRQAVIVAMAAAKALGGYVCMPTAAPVGRLLLQKTLQNYMVFIETALEHGGYY